jgi:hypothetical protein
MNLQMIRYFSPKASVPEFRASAHAKGFIKAKVPDNTPAVNGKKRVAASGKKITL